ncbi:MAG: hypothetical protein K8R87_13510 [Verrucomicrobia bacterium]|nr:hypothetical protein [Verrucomicrobiota bacterium]
MISIVPKEIEPACVAALGKTHQSLRQFPASIERLYQVTSQLTFGPVFSSWNRELNIVCTLTGGWEASPAVIGMSKSPNWKEGLAIVRLETAVREKQFPAHDQKARDWSEELP